MPTPTISQEAFNSAVKENVSEFGMEPEEAVQSAVEELRLQGVDLTGLTLTASAPSRHPAEAAAEALLESQPGHCAGYSTYRTLEAAVRATDPKAQLAAATVAQKIGVVQPLLQQCAHSGSSNSNAAQEAALDALAAVLVSPEARDELAQVGACTGLCRQLGRAESGQLAEALASTLSAAVTKNETNKTFTVDAGLGEAVQHVLSLPDLPGSAVVAVCELLRRCCNADDDRPVVSRAFQNGRSMGSQGVPVALLQALKAASSSKLAPHANGSHASAPLNGTHEDQDAALASEKTVGGSGRKAASPAAMQTALCSALKWMLVNEEICTAFADDGGLSAALQVLKQGTGQPGVVRTSAALLRQLAGSDSLKAALVQQGALDAVTRAARLHISHNGALEQVLGLLAALTLRNPDGSEAAMEAGCIDATLEVMHANMARAPAAQWVQRQACQAIRNVAGRCPELRPSIVDKGAEPLLRKCASAFPAACKDVSSAALRDLGFDNY